MGKKSSGISEFVAVFLAAVTVLAAIVVVFFFGQSEVLVEGRYGTSPKVEQITNWPLVISVSISAIYAVLFANLFCSIQRISDRVIDIGVHLGAKETKR